jgi:hypothetical protein
MAALLNGKYRDDLVVASNWIIAAGLALPSALGMLYRTSPAVDSAERLDTRPALWGILALYVGLVAFAFYLQIGLRYDFAITMRSTTGPLLLCGVVAKVLLMRVNERQAGLCATAWAWASATVLMVCLLGFANSRYSADLDAARNWMAAAILPLPAALLCRARGRPSYLLSASTRSGIFQLLLWALLASYIVVVGYVHYNHIGNRVDIASAMSASNWALTLCSGLAVAVFAGLRRAGKERNTSIPSSEASRVASRQPRTPAI